MSQDMFTKNLVMGSFLKKETIIELRRIAQNQPRKATVEDLRKVLQPYLQQLPIKPTLEPKPVETHPFTKETLSLPMAMALGIEKILNQLKELQNQVATQKTHNEELEALEKQALERLLAILNEEERIQK